MLKKEKILVIGGTGFLGSRIVDHLKKENYKVRILSRNADQIKEKLNYKCDITEKGDTLEKAVEESDVVIHCAGKVSYNPKERDVLQKLHVDGTRNIVKVCSEKGKKLIYTSSAAVLGISTNFSGNIEEQLLQIEDIKHNKFAYFTTKYLAEEIVKNSELEAIILRPGSLIGPGETSTSKIFDLVNKRIKPIFLGGASFVYVEDVAQAYVNALKKLTTTKRENKIDIYNLGGHNLSFNKLTDAMQDAVGKKSKLHLSQPILFLIASFSFFLKQPKFTWENFCITDHIFYVNSSNAKEKLDYNLTPLEEALVKTAEQRYSTVYKGKN